MIAPIMQALNPFFRFVTTILFLPWTVWERVRETIRTSVSLNGYTAINPDGVLAGRETSQDENEEATGKEES